MTYIPGSSLDEFRKRLAQGTAPKNPLSHVTSQNTIKSLTDQVWESTNAATASLIKLAGQPDLSKKLTDVHKQTTLTETKKPARKQAPLKRERPETEEVAAQSVTPRQVDVPRPTHAPDIVVETLEQHMVRDNQLDLFAQAVAASHGRAANEMVIKAPPKEDVLRIGKEVTSEWYYGIATLVANTPGQKYPDVPCFTRQVLTTFMREADPNIKWERPCFNLDREPRQGEQRVRCIAHRITAKDQEPYRLREMLFNDEEAKIAASPKGTDPLIFLPSIPEMCVLCHIWFGNIDYIRQKDKARERNTHDHTTPPADLVTICNRFMVKIDQPGEYDSRKIITCDRNALGIWGPFPVFNENNYIPCRVGVRLRGIKETDNLLFRLPRAASTLTSSGQGNTTLNQ